MIHYLTLEGRWMFSEYLEHWGRELASNIRVLLYEQLLETATFEPGSYLFTTFDEVTPSMGRYIDALAARFVETPGVRVLNDPARVVRRFDLHAKLWEAGRNRFRSRRVTADLADVRYPAFLRAERSHDGALSPLLHSAPEVEAWIGRVLALGRRLDDLMVVEFCDTADSDGFYRKYAAFNVDGTIVPRSLSCGREWMLKFAGTELSMAMAQEELDYVNGNPHRAELEEIFRIGAIDYGRIDYSMLDGCVQTWEININPTIGRGLRPSSRAIDPELRETRETTKETFYASFNAAWAAMAMRSAGAGLGPVAIAIDPRVIAEARRGVRGRWRTRSAFVGAGVRLAKPLMKTPLRPFLRALYRLPRRIVHGSAGPLFRLFARRARKNG